MSDKAFNATQPRLLFTAPWEPIVVRRGDALGLSALTDRFGDAVAPGLSNRISDARWVTILAWCLAQSDATFRASGGNSVDTRVEQRRRYNWLRPLELMWVARTLALLPDQSTGRTLNGIRSVKPWFEIHRMKSERFGMSEAQFRAYRQTGLYGGYRLAFRKWPGLTRQCDGWTPGPVTHKLAKWLDDRLSEASRPNWRIDDADSEEIAPSARHARDREHHWWLKQWGNFNIAGRQADTHTLPRPRNELTKLPEAHLLKPLIFGSDADGLRRRAVVSEIAASKAVTHTSLCIYLAQAFPGDSTITALPRFARMADAGMAAMDFVAQALGGMADVALDQIVRKPGAESVCHELYEAAQAWRAGQIPDLRHVQSASYFADSISSAKPVECLQALLAYHEVYAGGLRWFVLRNERVEARAPARFGSSRYGFRFWPLSRLAVQCGVVDKVPPALLGDLRDADDEAADE